MKLVTIANLKGGVGKTTTTIYLSALASRTKIASIIDVDPQASASEWVDELGRHHGDITLEVFEAPSTRLLTRMISEARELPNDGFVFIDTPPGSPELAYLAMQNSDCVVVPTRAGLLEVPRVALTLRLVPEGTPTGIVITAANARTNAFQETAEAWRESENLLGHIRARTALTAAFSLDENALEDYEPIWNAIRALCYSNDVI